MGKGVEVETALDPVLTRALAAWPLRIRVVEMWPVARLITGDGQDAAISIGLDFIGRVAYKTD